MEELKLRPVEEIEHFSGNGQAAQPSALTNLRDPKLYFNRELSWVKFNERVLEEAEKAEHPLLERLKFISIFSSNLDEFFMIRVAGLKEQVNAHIYQRTPDGLTPSQQIQKISEMLHPLVRRQGNCLKEDILKQLKQEGVRIWEYDALNPTQRKHANTYFNKQIFPLLTPLAIDNAHPFPKVRGLGLNLLVELRDPFSESRETKLAVVPIPRIVPRFIAVKDENTPEFVALEEVVAANLGQLFPNMNILEVSLFRVTRNADLDISEAEADDLLKLIERELRKRRLGTIVRLEVTDQTSQSNVDFLAKRMGLEPHDIYRIPSFLGLDSFMQLVSKVDRPGLKDAPFTPALNLQVTQSEDIFAAIRKGDILLHHPYDSFNPVIEYLKAAARDPNVLAIKMTLYRTSGDSRIVRALKEAAANGIQVTALIELKARFDEEANITWARELERAGVNVAYGLIGLKTHCKLALVVRREPQGIQRYIHLSTGNYNEKTATLYTDIGMFTCDEQIGQDTSEVFNLLTGYSNQEQWRKLFVSPINMRQNFKRLIATCIQHHTPEAPSRIRLVMNSLVDPDMIRALYKASMKGVQVECVTRGICCLRPGVPGISDNIRVISIVGRFLEHPRIFSFAYNGQEKIYTGSADWMQRNLNRRIEVVFPVSDKNLKRRLSGILDVSLNDNVLARELQPDGTYRHREPEKGEVLLNSQLRFIRNATKRQQRIDTTLN